MKYFSTQLETPIKSFLKKPFFFSFDSLRFTFFSSKKTSMPAHERPSNKVAFIMAVSNEEMQLWRVEMRRVVKLISRAEED